MISGAKPGKGGKALSAHLLKGEKGQEVTVIRPRGVATRGDLHEQLKEIVAGTRHCRAGKPIYHIHLDPPPDAPDCQVVIDAWWRAFEVEFGLTSQAYCGAQHLKHGRRHEHRAYSLARPDGRAVDVTNDFPRRTYVNLIVGFELGLIPAPTPHARSVAFRLAQEGRDDVIAWMSKHGLIDADKPVAPVTSAERLIESRTGIELASIRSACLAAWDASSDGPGFARELAQRGLELRQGTAGPIVVDASGTAHSVARAVGRASRERGQRIPAGEVKARIGDMKLEGASHGQVGRNPRGSEVAVGDPGRAVGSPGAGGGRAGQRHVSSGDAARGRGSAGPAGERGRSTARGSAHAEKSGRRVYARARLRSALANVDWKAVDQAERLSEKLKAISRGTGHPTWIPGQTDIWGVPIS